MNPLKNLKVATIDNYFAKCTWYKRLSETMSITHVTTSSGQGHSAQISHEYRPVTFFVLCTFPMHSLNLWTIIIGMDFINLHSLYFMYNTFFFSITNLNKLPYKRHNKSIMFWQQHIYCLCWRFPIANLYCSFIVWIEHEANTITTLIACVHFTEKTAWLYKNWCLLEYHCSGIFL